MTKNETEYITNLANQLILYCAQNDIAREKFEERAKLIRTQFKLVTPATAGERDASQPNNQKVIDSEGDEELIKLKYGQGSIGIRKRTRKDGSVYKIYAGTYYNALGQHKTVYAKTQKECLRKLKEANPRTTKTVKQKYLTVKDWLIEWFNTFKVIKIRANTVRSYKILIDVHIMPALADVKLIELNGEQLQKFFNSIKRGNTRKKTYELLRACLEKAVALRKITYNPCDAVELATYKKQKRRPFTYEEQNQILTAGNVEQQQIFYFLCCTGLRIGEFLALRTSDFNFDERYFIINKSETEEGECKTEASNRVVYFTDELLQNFDVSLLGKYKYAGLRTLFRRLFDKLELKDVCLHCTRHTFATVCYSLKMNDKTLQSLLGHATLAMTQDTYTHIIKKGDSKIRRYLQVFCEHICTII